MTGSRIAAALVLAASMCGCSAFEDHNKETKQSRNNFEAGQFDAALADLQKGIDNELDGLCYQFDSGVVAQVAGKYDVSIRNFEKAEGTIEKFEDRGATAKGAAQQIGAFAVNEKTIPYEGESFEKILVPVFNSRNYLLQHQMEDAMVEVRKIWFQQKVCKQANEKEIDETNEKAKENKVDTKNIGDVDGQCAYPADALKSPESIYEITFAHYISALISERMGEINDAYISMKDVAKIRPDLKFVQKDLVRLAKANYFSEDIEDYKKRFPDVKEPGKDEGSVALMFDCGWAPHKEELKFLVPGYKSVAAVAIPLYKRTADPASHARLVLNDKVFETRVLSDLEAIVFKYHREKMPTIIVRAIIRATIKAAAASAAAAGTEAGTKGRKGSGVFGALAGAAVSVYNVASEQADLRAWLTLPRNFQAVRAWVPAGEYTAKVELMGTAGNVLNTVQLGKLNVKPGSLRFACARSLGPALFGTLLAEREDKAPKVKKPAGGTGEKDLKPPADAPGAATAKDKTKTSDKTAAPDAEKPAAAPDKTKTEGEAPPADKDAPPAAPDKDKKTDEAPKADAPPADAPKADAPPADAPKADAPKPEEGDVPKATPKGE